MNTVTGGSGQAIGGCREAEEGGGSFSFENSLDARNLNAFQVPRPGGLRGDPSHAGEEETNLQVLLNSNPEVPRRPSGGI